MSHFRTSVRTKISVLLLTFSLGPILLLAVAGGIVIGNQLTTFAQRLERTDVVLHSDVVGRNLRGDAFDVASEVDSAFFVWETELRNWSEEDIVVKAAHEADRIALEHDWQKLDETELQSRFLGRFSVPLPAGLSALAASYLFRQAERPHADAVGILVTGTTGINALLTRPVAMLIHRNESWWKSALSPNGWFLEPAFRDPVSAKPVVGLSLPVVDTTSGQVAGVVHADFNLENLKNLLDQKANALNATIRVLDSAGQVIFDTDDGAKGILVGSDKNWNRPDDPGYLSVHAPSGMAGTGFVTDEGTLVGYARTSSPGLDWGVLVSQPEATAMQVLSGLMKTAQDFSQLPWYLVGLTSLALVLVAIFAGLVAVTLSRGLTRPLVALAGEAEKVQAGDLSAHIEITSDDEVGLLGKAFNTMIVGLREREREKDVFGRVVSPAVREKLLAGELALGGETRWVSVLFSDIRGFSTMVESQQPQEAVSFLNEYLTEMSEAVRPWGGYINNFIGDAIVVIFGAPLDLPGHETAAVRAALAMRERLAGFNGRREAGGLAAIRSGIGIATGEAVAGQIGSLERLQYTVIGDAVNVAARLETLTQQFPDYPILVNKATAQAVALDLGVRFIDLGPQAVKGRLEAVEVSAVVPDVD